MPRRLHERDGRRVLVAFDEFQDVLPAGNADAVIRSQIQHHGEAASYIFAGSHVGMMEQLFADKRRAFNAQAKPIAFPPLDPLDLGEFITDRFATTGKDIGTALGSLLDTAASHPHRLVDMTGNIDARLLPEEGIRLLDRFCDEVHELLLALRARVFAVAPRATEVVTDVGYTVAFRYGPDSRSAGQFVYLTGFSAHANLGFIDGATLPDPAGVLEGNGARMRHMKFRAVDEVADATWLEAYLRAALARAGLDADIGDGRSVVRLRRL